jgi:hypothetical protein
MLHINHKIKLSFNKINKIRQCQFLVENLKIAGFKYLLYKYSKTKTSTTIYSLKLSVGYNPTISRYRIIKVSQRYFIDLNFFKKNYSYFKPKYI